MKSRIAKPIAAPVQVTNIHRAAPKGNWSDPLGRAGNAPFAGNWSDPLGRTRRFGLGYHPDLPDHRDYGWGHFGEFMSRFVKDRHDLFAHLSWTNAKTLPDRIHLGDEHPLPPVEDQGDIGSCTAQAAVGLVEFLYQRATGKHDDFSRLFVYFNSRKLLGWKGDTGAYIRTTFKSMRLFGVPPETDWPYDAKLLDVEPNAYHYAYAGNFKTMKYARLDDYDGSPAATLERVQRALAAGFPVAFGFPVYSSIQTLQNFTIPVPGKNDKLWGGHAVLAVGYDNGIEFDDESKSKQKGALIIRNSWSANWGDGGYAFLPYWYLLKGYAVDFWTAYDRRWLDLSKFEE